MLPFRGPAGILTRYLSSNFIDGGKGTIEPNREIKIFPVSLLESFEHTGPSNTTTGLYVTVPAAKGQLYLNLGIGAVIFENLPDNDGVVRINYYGDTLGFRDLDVTPYKIAAEVLNDLNEAFKMLVKYSA